MAENKETKEKQKKKSLFFKENAKGQRKSGWMTFLRLVVAPIIRLVFPFQFYGGKRVKDGACVYVCNHYHWFDPIYAMLSTKEGIHFMAKKEIRSAPVIGFIADKVKTIWLNRDGTDARGIMDALKCLKSGEKIAIFPEGTRNKTNEPFLPFKPGAAMLAIRTKTPVVPLLIYEKPKAFKKAHVLVGEPFELSEYYDQKLNEKILAEADDKILQTFIRLRETHAAFLQEKKKKGK